MLSPRDSKIVELWLEKHPNPHTRYCYSIDSKRLLNHVKKPLARITLGDLQSFSQSLDTRGWAVVSRARTLAAVKSLFAFCHRMRYLLINPAAEPTLPSYENRLAERILGDEEVLRMLAAETEPRNRRLLRLLYVAGLRVSEACHLRWRNFHVRGNAGQITVFGKSGRTRAIALPVEVWAEMTGQRGTARGEDLVFQSRSGRPLDRGRVRMIIRRAAQRVGVAEGISPHWLRHAHASHALDRGAPIHLVQATLGHSSVATTSRYLHARPDDSSARFLALERSPVESCEIDLLVSRAGGMNVLTAIAAEGERTKMSTKIVETQENKSVVGQDPKPPKKANAGVRKPRVAPAKGKATTKATHAKKGHKTPKARTVASAREGSKTAKVLDLLKRPGGATLKELMKVTGWQPHSVRGFLSGTVGKKMGLTVGSAKGQDGERSYSITG